MPSATALKPADLQPPEFGEPMPLFVAATDGIASYDVGVAGGRWMILLFFGSLASPASRDAHALCLKRQALFDDANAVMFGVSADPADRSQRGLANHAQGVRYFWDFDLKVSRLYGLVGPEHLQPAVFLVDRALRIVMAEPIQAIGEVLDALEAALAGEARSGADAGFAPVLELPRLFEPELCERLVALHRSTGGEESGFAADVDGRTTTVLDARLKRRFDVSVEDAALVAELRSRLERRLFPMVKRAFNWSPAEIERYLVCRYGSSELGFFSAHRDDVTLGTAHRKFAVSLNLNADYAGGELRFPEFGRRLYKPEPGGAVVFCCSLLHEALPVTAGERYVFVPFLHDARPRRGSLRLAPADPHRDLRRRRNAPLAPARPRG